MDKCTDSSSTIDISDYQGESKDLILNLEQFASKKIEKETFNKKEETKKFFGCNRWLHSIPILLLIDNLIEVICHGIKQRLTYKEVYKLFFYTDQILNKSQCYECKKEGHYKKKGGCFKFEYYCPKCDENLCKICLRECRHSNRIILINKKKDVDYWVKEIKTKLENPKGIDYYLIKIIQTILNNYSENFNNYSYFPTIESIYNFLFSKK